MSQLSEFEIDIQTKLLRATFLKNLVFCQKFLPGLFQLYQNYQPKDAKLTFDHNGEVNIVNKGSLVYADSPVENSKAQVDEYLKAPRQFASSISFSENPQYEHEKQLQKLYEKRISEVGEDSGYIKEAPAEQMDFLVMIGAGLGYHIEELISRTKVKHFYIWEPDKDVFYCAMHILDLSLINQHCINLYGSLTIKVGGNQNQFVNEIYNSLQASGVYNMARLYMYRHYRSEETDNGFKNLNQICYRLLSGLGFFEDEIISISHTLTAIEKELPLLKALDAFDNQIKKASVFVVGNGPSLDEHLEFIKKNNDNAIIFSCGTALKAILDAGIIPDFHIEMERVAAQYEWIDQVGHKEKLKRIKFISLNNVYSGTSSLFKESFIIAKPKDGGMDFLYEYIDKDIYPGVYACNPTVTNAATAIAIRLGFTQLYLFGVDFGFKDESKHHATNSMHNQKDYHGYKAKVKSAFAVKGNFCDEVLTTQIFDSARGSMEMLLEAYSSVHCFNCSDGAYIQLTTPARIEKIDTLPLIANKEDKLALLLNDAFSNEIYANADFMQLFAKKLPTFEKIIGDLRSSCKTEIEDRAELSLLFSHQFQYVSQYHNKPESEVFFRFIGGTLSYFQTNIMVNVFYFSNLSERQAYIRWALGLFEQHLAWLFEELKTYYNKPSKY
jgi:hypothetical protein